MKIPGSVVLMLALVAGMACGGELAQSFREPPELTKPWCYWYWIDAEVTREGITRDLEHMVRVGIRKALIGNVNVGSKPASKKNHQVWSAEWRALTRHALKEAARVGVEIYMFNSPGWSQAGGPWIKPEQSMRRVSWSEYQAQGGAFSAQVRPTHIPASQDIAVLAVPRHGVVSVRGISEPAVSSEVSLQNSQWIWHPKEDGSTSAAAGKRYFKLVFHVDTVKLKEASIRLTADNIYELTVNGQNVGKDSDWQTIETHNITPQLKAGENIILIGVENIEAGPGGLIAAVQVVEDGKSRILSSDKGWLASLDGAGEWTPAKAMGPMAMMPWALGGAGKKPNEPLVFKQPAPFTARSLVVDGPAVNATLFAVRDGNREKVADFRAGRGNPVTDFMPAANAIFGFPDVTAARFELVGSVPGAATLSSEPMVPQYDWKQMGRMHPTPSPTWDSYRFLASTEPGDSAVIPRKAKILDLTSKMDASGQLNCTLPEGEWTVIYFGMVTTGKKNAPAAPEATGLECDKMSRAHIEYHFEQSFGPLLKELTPEERSAFTGVVNDSYETGSQNWTDNFAEAFEKRNGYSPIPFLPTMTGRQVESAKASDQFLWDLRRTVADMISECYVGGLRDVAHKYNLRTWLENYGHWGFPGEFLSYARLSDEVAGEFWVGQNLGNIECRAASSACHIYGKRQVYAEAFTSSLNLGFTPLSIKARGEELFCEGINHFVLHVYASQTTDTAPGRNPWFGTAFHRNNPWARDCRDWIKYLQRCHYMLQQGEPVADVAVYIGDFAPQMTGPANPVPGGYDYDYMGSDAILHTLHVVNGEWVVYDETNPKRIAARWPVLAIPADVGYIRPKVLKRLEELKQAGGKVVGAVPVPVQALKNAGIVPLLSEANAGLRWKARRLDDGMIFFLSNFARSGLFTAKLRVTGKVPELYNPATGAIKRLAQYQIEPDGTRIWLNVKDNRESFFLVFREASSRPSVVKSSMPDALELYYGDKGELIAESARAGTYTLTFSDGNTKGVTIPQAPAPLPIKGAWTTSPRPEQPEGYSVVQETAFDLPQGFGKNARVVLDLGAVTDMAKITINDHTCEMLWVPPFVQDVTGAVKEGNNKLKIVVTSALGRKPALGDVSLRAVPKGGVSQ